MSSWLLNFVRSPRRVGPEVAMLTRTHSETASRACAAMPGGVQVAVLGVPCRSVSADSLLTWMDLGHSPAPRSLRVRSERELGGSMLK